MSGAEESTGSGPSEPMDDEAETSRNSETQLLPWRGTSIEKISRAPGCGPQLHRIKPSQHHTVMFKLPVVPGSAPEPYARHPPDEPEHWDPYHVHMPQSPRNMFPVSEADERTLRWRWDLIRSALSRKMSGWRDIQAAIFSYNRQAPEQHLDVLEYLFESELEEEEEAYLRDFLLPWIAQTALRAPDLFQRELPLLRRKRNSSVSMSQEQVVCLLANAFFCTFPKRNSKRRTAEYATFPAINFFGLLQTDARGSGSKAKESKKLQQMRQVCAEKLKCVLNYFRCVYKKGADGVVTITRRHFPPEEIPKWEESNKPLPAFHVTSEGNIETEGEGMLQVDFANKFVGGGFLGPGCVQEEIRFALCPELAASMLICESMEDTECILIHGCQRFSRHRGYGGTFEWNGTFRDETAVDQDGRRITSVVAIDALYFSRPFLQYSPRNVRRELGKAYVGFAPELSQGQPSGVATGNWGCGVFHGDPRLKCLLQLMAAAESGRGVVYFTFGDRKLRDHLYDMYALLEASRVDVGRLFAAIGRYGRHPDCGRMKINEFLCADVMGVDKIFDSPEQFCQDDEDEDETERKRCRVEDMEQDNSQSPNSAGSKTGNTSVSEEAKTQTQITSFFSPSPKPSC